MSVTPPAPTGVVLELSSGRTLELEPVYAGTNDDGLAVFTVEVDLRGAERVKDLRTETLPARTELGLKFNLPERPRGLEL